MNTPGLAPSAGSPSAVIAGQILASSLALVSAPIVARAVGPEGRGVAAAAIACFILLPALLGLGLPLEARRRAAATSSTQVARDARTLSFISLVPASALAVLLLLTVFRGVDDHVASAVVVGCLATPIMIMWATDVSVLIAFHRYWDVFILRVTGPSVYILLILGLWMSRGTISVAEVIYANISGGLASAAVSLFMVRPPRRRGPSRRRELLRASFRYSGGVAVEGLSNQLPQVVGLWALGAQGAGLFSVAATVGSAPAALAHGLSAATFASVASSPAVDRHSLVVRVARESLALAAMASALVLVAAPLVPVVFGSAFAAATIVTCTYALCTFALVANFVLSMSLAAQGFGWRMTAAQVSSLTVGLACFTAFGIWRGATAATGGLALGWGVATLLLLRFSGISLREAMPLPRDFAAVIGRLRRRNGST